MRVSRLLPAVIACGFAITAGAENVGTTNDGGLKVGPRPNPQPAPPAKVLEPTRNENSGAFGTKPKGPVTQKPPPAVAPVPRGEIVSNGEAVLKATYAFDFARGRMSPEGGLFYEHRDEVARFLRPQKGATAALLPRADFQKLDSRELRALRYSKEPINASDNADNALRRGTVVAVRTRDGHFAKMRVTSYGRDLAIEWVTYR